MRTRRRAAVLGVVVTTGAVVLTTWLGTLAVDLWPGWGRVPVDGAVGFLATFVAAGLAAWASTVLAAATVPLLGPARGPAGGAPGPRGTGAGTASTTGRTGPVARTTAALLAAAALGLWSTAAHAGPQQAHVVQVRHAGPAGSEGSSSPGVVVQEPQAGPSGTRSSTDGAPVPGWTPTPAPGRGAGRTTERSSVQVDLVTAAHERSGTPSGDDHVVVRRGDTLWAIAARHLGGPATDADVAEAWPRWYAANREVIGADPDHIRPGQLLVPPAEDAR